MRVLVVDDEPLARGRIVRMLRPLDWIDEVVEAANVKDALAAITAAPPNIMLLDIQMPDGTGFDLLRQLDSSSPGAVPSVAPSVVMVTAFDDRALEAFDAHAIDYVTKPIEPGRFLAAIERARRAASQQMTEDRVTELEEVVTSLRARARQSSDREAEIWVRHGGEYIRITPERITHILAERDYVRVHTGDRDYLYHENLASLERVLPAEAFKRIHRSAIVRLDAVDRIRRGAFSALSIVLADGTELRVGRTYAAELRRLLGGGVPR